MFLTFAITFVAPACSFVERASPLIQLPFKRNGAEPISGPASFHSRKKRRERESFGSSGGKNSKATGKTMKIKQKLQNPFALIAQGFVAGAIILYATTPANVDGPAQDVPVEAVTAGAAAEISRA